MCLIAYLHPNYRQWNSARNSIAKAAHFNTHGMTVSVFDGKWDVVLRHTRSSEEIIKQVINKYKDYPLAIHLRYATSGEHNLNNTHPFEIKGKDADLLLYHNGIIPLDQIGEITRGLDRNRRAQLARLSKSIAHELSQMSDTALLAHLINHAQMTREEIVFGLTRLSHAQRFMLLDRADETPIFFGTWLFMDNGCALSSIDLDEAKPSPKARRQEKNPKRKKSQYLFYLPRSKRGYGR